MLSIRQASRESTREPVMLSLRAEEPASRTSIGAKRNPQSTRAILDAAGMLLRNVGPAGFSIDAIARLARCGKPTVYRWWPDKLALLLDLHDAQLDQNPAGDDLTRYWDRNLAGAILRAAFAEALMSPDALARFRSRVAARYADARPLGDWLLGGAIEPNAVADVPTPTSVRHQSDWVD